MKPTNTLIATVLAVASASAVSAQDTYVSVYGGFANLSDTELEGTVGGASQSVEVQSDGGYSAGIAIGREIANLNGTGIRGELELSYAENEADDLFFSGNGPAAEINVDGDLATTRLFANVIADFETGSAVTPYLGGGLGVSRSEFDITYGPGVALDDESDNVSAQLILGAAYAVSSDVSIFSDVRFIRDFDVETDRFNPAGALTGTISEDVDSTNFNIGVAFSF